MYGLVNRAIEQMVCRDHGNDVWQRIKATAGVETAGFVSNSPYPDDVTYRLVDAASQVLEQPAEAILRAFGEFWVLHTALESYGPLMRAGGRSAREFLLKLPSLHTRVQSIYPDLRPPEFECDAVTDESLVLHYRTARPAGLEPFVEGLVQGIGQMYDTPLTVRILADRRQGADHSAFHVNWGRTA
jgi:hypothetical protein